MKVQRLNIDIETYSPEDLVKVGVYKYCDHPDFEILLFGYSIDGGEVNVVDLACGEEIPQDVLDALTNNDIKKHAYNAQFERVAIGKMIGKHLDPRGWRCTMVHAAYLVLPGSLAAVGTVLNIDSQKYEDGKDLIKIFSVPRKPTKNNPATRIYPKDKPEQWNEYKYYNKVDVLEFAC